MISTDSPSIWSLSYRGHLIHAFPNGPENALCRRGLSARIWAPTWTANLQTKTDATELHKLCPKCAEKTA